MCGIFGILNVRANVHSASFLKDAFLTSMVRGVDSSGIMYANLSSSKYEVQKLPIPGLYFPEDNYASSLMEATCKSNTMAICHVRAATVGKVTLSNAHPFEVEDEEGYATVGVHNGTLTGWNSRKDARYFDVDSEWALHRIASDGIEAFKDFSGAYAFVWWGGRDAGILHMARNAQRPMHIVFLDNGGMAWASEAGMLYWLLERNNIKMDGPVLSLDENKLYKFPVDDPKKFTKEDLPSPVTSVYTPPTYSGYSQNRYYHATTVDKVEVVIKKIMEDSKKQTFPMVKEEEVEAARKTDWLDAEVEFTCTWVDEDNNISYGDAILNGTKLDAMMRGDFRGEFDDNNVWICRVEGIIPEGVDTILVLGKPLREYEREEWEADSMLSELYH